MKLLRMNLLVFYFFVVLTSTNLVQAVVIGNVYKAERQNFGNLPIPDTYFDCADAAGNCDDTSSVTVSPGAIYSVPGQLASAQAFGTYASTSEVDSVHPHSKLAVSDKGATAWAGGVSASVIFRDTIALRPKDDAFTDGGTLDVSTITFTLYDSGQLSAPPKLKTHGGGHSVVYTRDFILKAVRDLAEPDTGFAFSTAAGSQHHFSAGAGSGQTVVVSNNGEDVQLAEYTLATNTVLAPSSIGEDDKATSLL